MKTGTLLLLSADGRRLLGGWDHGVRVLRMPSGEHESDIDTDMVIHRSAMDRLAESVIAVNSEEIWLIDKASGIVWMIHLAGGARERRAQLEHWPGVSGYATQVPADRGWVCAPTSNPIRENEPTFAIWSTRTGKVLARSEAISFSPEERRSAQRSQFGVLSACQIAPDGKYVMFDVDFGNLARSRVYQVNVDSLMMASSKHSKLPQKSPLDSSHCRNPKRPPLHRRTVRS